MSSVTSRPFGSHIPLQIDSLWNFLIVIKLVDLYRDMGPGRNDSQVVTTSSLPAHTTPLLEAIRKNTLKSSGSSLSLFFLAARFMSVFISLESGPA